MRDVARTEIAAKNHSPGAPPPLAPPAPVVGTDPLDELTQDPEDKLLLNDELPGIDPPDELEELEDELLEDELLDGELELLLDDELLGLDKSGNAARRTRHLQERSDRCRCRRVRQFNCGND